MKELIEAIEQKNLAAIKKIVLGILESNIPEPEYEDFDNESWLTVNYEQKEIEYGGYLFVFDGNSDWKLTGEAGDFCNNESTLEREFESFECDCVDVFEKEEDSGLYKEESLLTIYYGDKYDIREMLGCLINN